MMRIVTASVVSIAVLLSGCEDESDDSTGVVSNNTTAVPARASTAAPAVTTSPDMVATTVASLPNIVGLASSVEILSTLVSALTAAELVDTLSNADATFTVFAPNNQAFEDFGSVAELLKPENKADLVDVLTFHVLPVQVLSTDLQAEQKVTTVQGAELTVTKTDDGVAVHSPIDMSNSANVLIADQMASNGVAHIIDSVLTPPANIVGLAQSVDDLSTLVTAIVAADLVETLSNADSLTVFAPSNAAFAAINDTVQDLLQPANKAALVDILKYHVLPVQVLSTELEEGSTEVETLQGQMLTVTTMAGTVTVGSGMFNVTAADQMAANGVVHIINGVLQPPTVTTTGTAASP